MARYVYKGAKLNCSLGTSPAFLDIEDRGMDGVGDGRFPAFKQDREPIKNIPSFGKCKVNVPFYPPCVPAPVPVWDVVVNSTSYHLLGEEYQNAYQAFVTVLDECIEKTESFFQLLYACAKKASESTRYSLYEKGKMNQAIEQAYNELTKIRDNYLSNETSILALSQTFRDTSERKLLAYGELFDWICKCYHKMRASLYNKKNQHGNAFDPLPDQDRIEEQKEHLKRRYQTAGELYGKQKSIEEAKRAEILASERLTMDSVLYCTNQADGVITIETPTREVDYDYHQIKEREIGIYNKKRAHKVMTLRFPQLNNLQMLAELDSVTKMHFLLEEHDFTILLPILGICVPEDYEAVKDEYIHKSLEELLAVADIELDPDKLHWGCWDIYLDVPAGPPMERYNNILGGILFANALHLRALKGEYNAKNPIPVLFCPLPHVRVLMFHGIKFSVKGKEIDVRPYIQMMEPAYREAMQEVADFFKSVEVEFKFGGNFTDGIGFDKSSFKEFRINIKNTKNLGDIQMGTTETGQYANVGSEKNQHHIGWMLTGDITKENFDYRKDPMGPGAIYKNKWITVKIFYIFGYIKVIIEVNVIKDIMEYYGKGFSEAIGIIPYAELYLWLGKDDGNERINKLIPEEHIFFTRLIPFDRHEYITDVPSMEKQLGLLFQTVFMTTEQYIASAVALSLPFLLLAIEIAAVYGAKVAITVPLLKELLGRPDITEKAKEIIQKLIDSLTDGSTPALGLQS